MLDESTQRFAVMQITPGSSYELVNIVRGRQEAETLVKELDEKLTQEQRYAGYKHFADRTSISLGTPLEVAKELRAAEYKERIYGTKRANPRRGKVLHGY